MAAPNLLSLTTWNVKTARLSVTTSLTDLIAAVTSNHAVSVNALYAANVHTSVRGWISVVHKRSSVEKYIAFQTPVGVRQTINILLGRTLVLEEGDSLMVVANAASNIDAFAPYDDVV